MFRPVMLLATGLALSACASTPSTKPPAPRLDAALADSFGNYLSARQAASDHNLADAAKFYRASLKVDPTNTQLLTRAFLYTASAGDVGRAAALAKQVVAKDPDNRAARTTLAVDAFKAGQYARAQEELSKSATGPFTALTISLLDSWALVGEHNIDGALAELDKMKEQGGADSLAAFQSALVQDLAGRDANSAYLQALKLSGRSPRIVDAYGRYLERTGTPAEAKAFYASLTDEPALQPIVDAALQRIAAGKKPARLVANPQEGAADALFAIGSSLTDDASADVSVLYLHFARYLRPKFDLADVLLGDRFEALGKYQAAIDIYDEVLPESPYYMVVQVQIAVDMARLDRNEAAIAKLKTVAAKDPDDYEAWTALGDIYRSVEKYELAADAYDHAIAARGAAGPQVWPLFYARAVAYANSDRWNLAQADLKHALKLSPDEPQLLNYLGYSWVDRDENLKQALAMLEKARALRPFDGYIADSVGWAYYRLGKYEEAAKTLQSAVQLVPGDSTINDHFGDALWRVGRKRDARFQWSHALAFGPDAKEKQALEMKIKDGLSGHKS